MLKIKEDKMQELEKFGFYQEQDDDDFYVWHFLGDNYPDNEPVYECRVVIKNAEGYNLEERAIYIGDYTYGIPSVVYDLIKNDMVEKVCEQKLAEIKGEKDE